MFTGPKITSPSILFKIICINAYNMTRSHEEHTVRRSILRLSRRRTVVSAQNTLRECAKRLTIRPNHIVHIRSCRQFGSDETRPAYWRKKANVSLDTVSPPDDPETKCGVAASLPPVRSSRASPVWKARGLSSVGGMRRTQAVGRDGYFDCALGKLGRVPGIDIQSGYG